MIIFLLLLASLVAANYLSATARQYTAAALAVVGNRVIDLGEALVHGANKLDEI